MLSFPTETAMLHRPLLALLVLVLAAGAAGAQDVRLYRAGEAVDPKEVAAILEPAPQGRMRSLRLLDDAAPQHGATNGADDPAPLRATPSALALPVQFGFDSAEILPTARSQLDALAEGIRLLPPASSVSIEGHTDASGSDEYNEKLSRRRAEAVKSYLVALHAIDPARLRTVGLGEHAPLAGRDAYASENRRVQFRGE
jgi:outer membrane protein OmpA-like peptidoglycan-associated protein